MYRLLALSVDRFRLLRERSAIRFPKGKNQILSILGENMDTPNASSNMSGKSTLANAITWALYGCDLTGAPLSANVISDGEKSCEVNLLFGHTTNPKERVRVKRFREKSTTTLSIIHQVEEAGRAVPTDEKTGVASQIQEYVDSVFGSKDVFLAAHVFGYDESYTPFALSSDKEQKRLFDLLIDSGDLDLALQRAKEALVKANREQQDAHEKMIAAQSSIATLRDNILSMQQSQKSALVDLRDEYERVKSEYLDAQRERNDRVKEYNAYIREYEAARRVADTEYRSALLDLNTSKRALEATKALGCKCPTCEQDIDPAYRQILSLRDSMQVEVFTEETEAKRKVLEALVAGKDKAKIVSDVVAARSTADALAQRVAQLKATFDSQKVNSTTAIDELRARLKEKEAAFTQLSDDFEYSKRAVKYADFWVTAFGSKGIRAMRLESAIPTLNAAARKYSRALFGDGQRVRYATTSTTKAGAARESFSVALLDKAGKEIEVRSAGQSLRRDVVNLFALSDLSEALGKRSCSLMILDEAFRTLDKSGVEAVCSVLESRRNKTALTLIIEHNDELSSRFDDSITVRRSGGYSRVVSAAVRQSD